MMETTSISVAAAIVVGILFPGYALIYGGKTHQLLSMHPDKKAHVMQVTAIQLIVLAVIALSPIFFGQDTLNSVGLDFITKPFWMLGLFIISFFGLWLFHQIKVTPESARKFKSENEPISFLFPDTHREYQYTILVSFVAGVCEEIIYRGFLLSFMLSYISLIPAILLANLPFALAHLSSTGLKNSMQAFILAMIFTAAFLLTESLWLSILLHILVDLYATILSYKSNSMMDSKETE
ncbi:MAG: CPBP family intramembrane glutamic endopeptidase [Reichenbachiella sp.]|uniref:CPBP family intramembrane glutamic endopeptidase n=1 Tax=Reichenbachiella sp. TaxID=2184521 RepID=UPI00326442D3